MLARNPDGEIVEVTKKAYSTLYRYRGWELVTDEEGKAQSNVGLSAAVETEEGTVVDSEGKSVNDLSKLRKAELQELASEKGIEVKAEYTKEDLINLLG